jgi:alpha-beta hydrolase superfamily lysophospholipase
MTIIREEHALTRRSGPGPSLYLVSAVPEGEVRATVGILHGYADHAARYQHVMDFWAESKIAVFALDMRGHGRALGLRGYCERFEEFLADAGELTRVVQDKARGGATFLFGHSFGGLVAASSAIEAPGAWRGLILSDPYFGLALDVPMAKIVAGRIASVVAPKLGIPSGLFGRDLTHDATRAAAYDADPLVFKKATARWFRESQLAQARALEHAKDLRLPLYLVFGSEDKVAKLSTAKTFFDRVASTDKTWDERKGAFHEVLNEPEWKDLAGDIAKWMLARA